MKNKINYFVFPSACFICEQTTQESIICHDCHQSLPFNQRACTICAMPLTESKTLCGHCIKIKKPWTTAFIPFHYKTPIDYLIKEMKFNANFAYLHLLAHLFFLAYQAQNKTNLPEVIIPVPLHPSRLSQRGYNQSLELAKIISRLFNIPIDNHYIQRHKKTLPQSSLNIQARSKNLKNSFKINPKNKHRYQQVVILDDVVTTGTTMTEIVKVIKKQGVLVCDIWALAKVSI